MTTKTHPWTFIHPHCGAPAFHAIDIPRTSEAARALIAGGGLHDLGGKPIPAESLGFAVCESCFIVIGAPLDFAAMTVEANWRRREPPIAAPAAGTADLPPDTPAAAARHLLEVRTVDGRTERVPMGELETFEPREVDSWECIPA